MEHTYNFLGLDFISVEEESARPIPKTYQQYLILDGKKVALGMYRVKMFSDRNMNFDHITRKTMFSGRLAYELIKHQGVDKMFEVFGNSIDKRTEILNYMFAKKDSSISELVIQWFNDLPEEDQFTYYLEGLNTDGQPKKD